MRTQRQVFNSSEAAIIQRIKNERQPDYDFWLVYDDNGNAVNYEGGYNLPKGKEFRNTYSLSSDGRIIVNVFD